MRHASRLLLLSVFAFSTVAPVQAQRTNQVRVVLHDCDGFTEPFKLVIMNDAQRIDLTRIATGVWTGTLVEGTAKRQAEGICGSLRLNGSRTDCEKSQAEKDENDAIVAVFTFHCNRSHARTVTIAPDPAIPFSYVRTLKKGPDERGCDCVEYGSHNESPYRDEPEMPVADLRFRKEKLILQFQEKADPNGPGLLIDDRTVVQKADSGDPPSVTLTQPQVVYALLAQRITSARNALVLSPAAIDIDEKKLVHLGTLRVVVK